VAWIDLIWVRLGPVMAVFSASWVWTFRPASCVGLAGSVGAALAGSCTRCGWSSAGLGVAEHRTPQRQRVDAAQESHGFLAAGALDDEGFGCGRARWGEHAEDVAQAFEFGLDAGAEEPVVEHAHEAFGQDVLAPSSQKIRRCERDDAPLAGGAALAVEAKVACCVIAEKTLLTERGLVDVAGEVAHGGLAVCRQRDCRRSRGCARGGDRSR